MNSSFNKILLKSTLIWILFLFGATQITAAYTADNRYLLTEIITLLFIFPFYVRFKSGIRPDLWVCSLSTVVLTGSLILLISLWKNLLDIDGPKLAVGTILTILISSMLPGICSGLLLKLLHRRKKSVSDWGTSRRRNNNAFMADVFLLTFSVIFLAIALLFVINFLDYEAPISYSKWRSISLGDFRGLNRPYNTLDGSESFAYIVTRIKIERVGDTAKVEAMFYPSRSYVYDRKLFNNRLLTHELYHFHIAEVGARELRSELEAQKGPVFDSDLEAFKEQAIQQEIRLQYEYDDETYHGYLSDKQQDWERRIDRYLDSLKDFSNTTVILRDH